MHTHIRGRRALPFKWIFRHCSSSCLDAPDEPQPQVSNEIEREEGRERGSEREIVFVVLLVPNALLVGLSRAAPEIAAAVILYFPFAFAPPPPPVSRKSV